MHSCKMPDGTSLAPDRHGGGVLDIDLGALARNWRRVQDRLSAGAVASAVVKADAYGLGSLRVASALYAAGCRFFYVAHLDEALVLSEALPDDAGLAVLHGLVAGEELLYVEKKIIPVLNSRDEVERWTRLSGGRPAFVHIDTGMNRLGLSGAELDWFLDGGGVKGLSLGALLSHLACADEPDHPLNGEQRARFENILKCFPGVPGSFANSSGVFLGREYHFQQARPGACLYGINPVSGHENPMEPVVALSVEVLQLRDVKPGETAGYGAAARFSAPRRLATVALGYADGFLRAYGEKSRFFIGDRPVPLAGRVSMDLVMLDVTGLGIEAVLPGTRVEVLGKNRDVDRAAQEGGTIGYEILTGLGRRFVRRYSG